MAMLSLVSGFATQLGTNNPLAEKTFYLAKESVESVLTKGGVGVEAGKSAFQSWLIACSNGTPECQQGQTALATNSASVLKTGNNGKAEFPPVPPGTYYIVGITRSNNQLLLWNLKVDVKAGMNEVGLDQRNSAPVK